MRKRKRKRRGKGEESKNKNGNEIKRGNGVKETDAGR